MDMGTVCLMVAALVFQIATALVLGKDIRLLIASVHVMDGETDMVMGFGMVTDAELEISNGR